MRIKSPSDSRRKRWRLKCEQCIRLDVRELSRSSLLVPGTRTYLFLRASEGEHFALIRMQTRKKDIELSYARGLKNERCVCSVPMERQRCHHGGERTWFRCPCCGSRRAVLFGFACDGKFGCRGCMDVVYASQDERKMHRLWRRQAKLERKLLDGYLRPPGMHWSTFAHTWRQLGVVFARQERLFCDGARAFLRRRNWL